MLFDTYVFAKHLVVRVLTYAQRAVDPEIIAGTADATEASNNGSLHLNTAGHPEFRVGGAWYAAVLSGLFRTINHATTSFAAFVASAKAVTTARTGGIVSAFQGVLTGLAGDTSGAKYAAFEGAAPVKNGGSAVYVWGYVAAGYARLLDLTAVATGEAIIALKDNLASALEIKEAATSYLKFITTDDVERVLVGRVLGVTTVTIDMNDVTHTLVYGAAGANQTKVTGNVLFTDPNSGGASEKLLLPPEATSGGVVLDIMNTGGEGIVVRDDGDATTIITIPTGKAGRVACNGTTWYGILGA